MSKAMRANLKGGISQFFNQCQIKNESSIRKGPLIKVLSIQGFDANSLYLSCTAMEMSTGVPRVYWFNEQKNVMVVGKFLAWAKSKPLGRGQLKTRFTIRWKKKRWKTHRT